MGLPTVRPPLLPHLLSLSVVRFMGLPLETGASHLLNVRHAAVFPAGSEEGSDGRRALGLVLALKIAPPRASLRASRQFLTAGAIHVVA